MSRRKTLVRVSVVATVLLCVGPGAVEGQFISPNAAAVSYDSPTVTVTGTAEEYAAPDRAIIHLELVSREATAEAAALANGSARSAVRERLIALGVPADDIGLWGVGTGGARSDFGPPRGGAESAFESRSGLRVELSDLERLDPVIATSLLAGASVSRVELEAHQRAEVEARVTAAAVREARASAEAMAEAAGGRLGTLLTMTSADAALTGAWMAYTGRPEGDWVTLDRTQTTVRAVVQVTWEYEPGGP